MKIWQLKPLVIVVLTIAACLVIYVSVITRKKTQMSARQKITKAFYPALMAAGKLFGKKTTLLSNTGGAKPSVSFYSLAAKANDGGIIPFSNFAGKKVLIVNTASACGFTPQYEELQALYSRYIGRLIVIGFPANDFGEQEKGSDRQIAEFCKLNYGVSFPLAQKTTVIKAPGQHPVFQWLTRRDENGWNDQPPAWNFSKYLVDERGSLTNYFESSVSPLSDAMITAIENKK